MSSKRSRKVADLIRQNVAFLLKKEVNDPRLAEVSIISVDLSADLGNAKIYFALPDVEKLAETQKAFERANSYLRTLLAERLGMRYVPRLHFHYDASIDRGAKISDLIEQALQSDEKLRTQNPKKT